MAIELSAPSPLSKSSWKSALAIVGIGAIGVYGIVYCDVVVRARQSYLEAEKYMEWARSPEKKRAYFEDRFKTDKAALERQHDQRRLSDDDFRSKSDTLDFDKNFLIQESSLKYAYQWYKDTYELFSPPESKWVKMARRKAPETLELWKQELREKKVPFEDYMLQ